MDWFGWLGAVGGSVGGVAGVGAAIYAGLGYKVAKDSKGVAKASADSAADAVRKADEANGIAVEANQLAGDANAIAKRALAVTGDHTKWNWRLDINDEGMGVVVNDCAHSCRDLSVLVDVGGEVVAAAQWQAVPEFGEIPLNFLDAVEKHFEQVRAQPAKPTAWIDGQPMGHRRAAFETVFRAHLSWLTVDEVRRSDVAEKTLRHRLSHDGKIEVPKIRRE